MYMKTSAFAFIFLILLGCNKDTESFAGVKFGKISKDSFLKEMLNNNTFTIFRDDVQNVNDTTAIGYVLKRDGKEFPLTVEFNEARNEKYGSLRQMTFYMGEDEKAYGQFRRSAGKISKEFVDDLFSTYTKMFGKPDSLTTNYKYSPILYDDFFEAFNAIKENKGEASKEIDKSYLAGKRAVWITDNFKLIFDIPFVKKSDSDNEKIYFQKELGSSISIRYQMHKYKEEIDLIRDSIATKLHPKDLIAINASDCKWINNANNHYNTRLAITIEDVSRLDKEEPKRIKGIKFDLVITDSFKEVLFRFKNLTIELPKGSYLESEASNRKASTVVFKVYPNKRFWVDFNRYENSELSRLKRYSENNTIKVEPIIKTILFEDGSIRNSN